MPNIRVPQIALGEPVMVHQAPLDVKRWGPWQFPHIERLVDGRLHIEYHIEADSVTAYGLPSGHAFSSDDGKTWEVAKDMDATGGLLLLNGDRLRPVQLRSRKRDEVALPEPVAVQERASGQTTHIYRAADLPQEFSGWRLSRLPGGQAKWIEETPTMRISPGIRIVREGVFVFWPSFHHGRLRIAPDGSIWAALHIKRIVGDTAQQQNNILFLRSSDQGHTWDLLSEILYQPDKEADPHADRRDGFTEPEFNFMPDDTVLCLMRTHDGLGVGPMYWSRSLDNGRSWSQPNVFDDCGVWPRLLTLNNSVTLAAYGRPGFYVRSTADPSGLEWEPRVVVVEPVEVGRNTCSYSGLIALDDHTALLAYSDFNYPDPQGQKRKTILARTLTVS